MLHQNDTVPGGVVEHSHDPALVPQQLWPERAKPIHPNGKSRALHIRRDRAVILRAGEESIAGNGATKFGDGDLLAGAQPILGRAAHIQAQTHAKRDNNDASDEQRSDHAADDPHLVPAGLQKRLAKEYGKHA
jgi:hypothetical protein